MHIVLVSQAGDSGFKSRPPHHPQQLIDYSCTKSFSYYHVKEWAFYIGIDA